MAQTWSLELGNMSGFGLKFRNLGKSVQETFKKRNEEKKLQLSKLIIWKYNCFVLLLTVKYRTTSNSDPEVLRLRPIHALSVMRAADRKSGFLTHTLSPSPTFSHLHLEAFRI